MMMSCGCLIASEFAGIYAFDCLLPRNLQPLDRLSVKRRNVPPVLYVQLIATNSSVVPSDQVQKLSNANMMDVMGMYAVEDSIETMSVFGGRPAYSHVTDPATMIWYYEGPYYERQKYDGWYGGPKEHLGTVKGMMKGGVGAGPYPPRYGWRISSMGESPEAFAFRIEALQALQHDEMHVELESGARYLRLWDDSNRPKLTLGANIPHSMTPRGIFKHDDSYGYEDGRPTYFLDGPFMMHTHRVSLWWSMAMECWCIGLDDRTRAEWQTCELRTHDAALLPEWTTQQWQRLIDERVLTAKKTDLCEMRQGAVYFQGTPLRYVEAISVRAVQLPVRPAHFAATWASQQLWRLGVLLAAFGLCVSAWPPMASRLGAALASRPAPAPPLPEKPPPQPPQPPVPPSPVVRVTAAKKKEKRKPSAASAQASAVASAQEEVERVRREAEALAAAQRREIESLRELAARQEVDAKLCVVCLDQEKRCMLRPCKHLCVCDDCAAMLMSDSHPACPVCRTRVEDVERVYTS